MRLLGAFRQWATRPEDERYPSLQAMYEDTYRYAQTAAEATIPFSNLRVENVEGDVQIVGKTNVPAKISHFAFGQIAGKIGAPANYLRRLPATLVVQNVNHGLKKVGEDAANNALAMFHVNGSMVLRSLTTQRYERVWNYEVVSRLIDIQERYGWQNLSDIGLKNGLYASDSDMFAFMIRPDIRVDDGTDEGLSRGFFVENSEVGAGALKITKFLYRHICGNHMIMGVKDVTVASFKHVGNIRKRFNEATIKVEEYANESASEEEAIIRRARQITLGGTKEDVLDVLFGKGIASRKLLTEAYESGEQFAEVDGSPKTVYGMSNALTRLSQKSPFGNVRNEIDRAGAKCLQIAF